LHPEQEKSTDTQVLSLLMALQLVHLHRSAANRNLFHNQQDIMIQSLIKHITRQMPMQLKRMSKQQHFFLATIRLGRTQYVVLSDGCFSCC